MRRFMDPDINMKRRASAEGKLMDPEMGPFVKADEGVSRVHWGALEGMYTHIQNIYIYKYKYKYTHIYIYIYIHIASF